MSQGSVHYPWFKREDIDAFFALFQNNIANFIIIALAMLGMGFSQDIVFGKVLPGAAVAVMTGNFYYAYMAKRLAQREQRTDVTALSYGISTPVMFVFLFGVLLPAKTITGDADLAWKIAAGACFLSGIIEVLVSLTGRWMQRNLPRAAMLGAVAGVAMTFIGGEMLFKTFEMPLLGLVVLGIIIVGIIGRVVMPFRLSPTFFAILIGTVLAYTLRQADPNNIHEGLEHLGFYPPMFTMAAFEGMGLLFTSMVGVLTVVLPITLYNAIETMNNVETMKVLGDEYDVRECQAVDGIGTALGALFGGLFPTTVYIASASSKWMNAGRGYSIANGVVYLLATTCGLIAALAAIIPVAVVSPILVFVGISMVATAYQANAKRYYPAVALAMLPYFGNYLMTRFGNKASEVVEGISSGIVPLGQGAMFTAMMIGAMTVCIIDHNFRRAAVFSFITAFLSFIGLIHAPHLGWNAAPDFTLGYIILGVFFLYFTVVKPTILPAPPALFSLRSDDDDHPQSSPRKD
ncbi:MAG TPA: hypothetical protein K8U84_05270 [Paenalcaligenes hominis]|uniref:AGZA family xanthine/uracil permease-like MFS transporter n=1 Tax=Paenalcaligenes hominis TaxID=643674 RepID=A0A9D2VGC1_9BURK|nr:hypothetical protein [Paenalcaligenes hominis]NJB65262.1 AGZA family xanthine/uracil permease-like MFS transporter [Paenalcaligenes hominis]GGE72207.1 permease [Paenalcaligenes hominis]HJH23949.1 hypothetical protein [Paenalcaligenes hominis]